MKTATPASPNSRNGSCRWVKKPIYPCDLIPEGEIGVLQITSYTCKGAVTACYDLSIHFDAAGREIGYTMTNQSNDHVYNINTEWGVDQWECTCGDSTFRSRLCKHSRALQASLKAICLL